MSEPIDLTAVSSEPVTQSYVPGEVFSRVPMQYAAGAKPDEGPFVVIPSLTECLTPKRLEGYLLGERTPAELFGLTMAHLAELANVGIGQLQSGKLHEARETLALLVNLNPKYARFRNLYGVALMRNDVLEEANVQFEKAIELDPNLHEAWQNSAELAAQRQDWPEVVRCAERAIACLDDRYTDEARQRSEDTLQAARLLCKGEEQ